MSRPDFVGEQPVDARTAEAFASGHIRFHEFVVLCGACGGLGCERCAEPEPPSRRARLWAALRGDKA
jgi:hypothetical protein